jgi:hypothetical protein
VVKSIKGDLMLYMFVDWENIRRSLKERYIEGISTECVLDALERVAEDLGGLQRAFVYGDFTLRRDDARLVERKPLFEYHNVLLSMTVKDRSDAVIIADIMEKMLQEPELDKILLCAGDSDYCDIVRRAIRLARSVFVCAVAGSAAQDLISLAPLYPIEKYLDMELTPRRPQITAEIVADPVMKWKRLVTVLDQLEKKLEYVSVKYFRDTILSMYQLGGSSVDDKFAYLEAAKAIGLVLLDKIEDQRRSGFAITTIKLNRENEIVRKILQVT